MFTATVDLSLLRRLTDQLLCSRCLTEGRRTTLRQVLSHRHRPRSLCPDCLEARKAEVNWARSDPSVQSSGFTTPL